MRRVKLHPLSVRDPQDLVPFIERLLDLLNDQSADVAMDALEALSSALKTHWDKLTGAQIERILRGVFEQMGSDIERIRVQAISTAVVLLKVDPPKVSSELFRMVQHCKRLQLLAVMSAFYKAMKQGYCPKQLPFRCIYHFFRMYVDSEDREIRQSAEAGDASMDFYF